jgi:hypothetical protein
MQMQDRLPAPAREQENFVQSTVTRGMLSACGVNRYSDTGVCVVLKKYELQESSCHDMVFYALQILDLLHMNYCKIENCYD